MNFVLLIIEAALVSELIEIVRVNTNLSFEKSRLAVGTALSHVITINCKLSQLHDHHHEPSKHDQDLLLELPRIPYNFAP